MTAELGSGKTAGTLAPRPAIAFGLRTRHLLGAAVGPTVLLAALLVGCGTSQPATGPGTAGAGPVSTMPWSPPAPSSTETSISPVTTTTVAPIAPGFAASVTLLDEPTRQQMSGASWRAGCPVGLDDLRLLSVSYWGFDGVAHQARLVVNADSGAAVEAAFRALFAARFPIRQMRLVEDFGAHDERSMAADNTSAFNYRLVPGTDTWSQHAYGRAVVIKPMENPEITTERSTHRAPPDRPTVRGRPWA